MKVASGSRSEELEVNQWIVEDIHWLSSQSQRAKILSIVLVYTKQFYPDPRLAQYMPVLVATYSLVPNCYQNTL